MQIQYHLLDVKIRNPTVRKRLQPGRGISVRAGLFLEANAGCDEFILGSSRVPSGNCHGRCHYAVQSRLVTHNEQ
jgi:hypothetical protein